jgi:hypothetical protein
MGWTGWPAYWKYFHRHTDFFRRRAAFRQTGLERKTPDLARKEWRERKGFNRDKVKGNCYWPGSKGRNSFNRAWKDESHHSRRAWEREMISKEQWDLLACKEPSYVFLDEWDLW